RGHRRHEHVRRPRQGHPRGAWRPAHRRHRQRNVPAELRRPEDRYRHRPGPAGSRIDRRPLASQRRLGDRQPGLGRRFCLPTRGAVGARSAPGGGLHFPIAIGNGPGWEKRSLAMNPVDPGDPKMPTNELLPVMPMDDVVVLPHMTVALAVEGDTAKAAIEAARQGNRLILLVPRIEGKYGTIGTVARLGDSAELPTGAEAFMLRA